MKVLFLNSCVHGGGAGRSLATYFHYKSKDIEATVVMPEEGIIAKEFAPHAKLVFMPEFVERIHRSPYKFASNIKSGLFHIILNSWALLVSIFKIRSLAKKIKPDLIYCNHMLAKPIGVIVGGMLGIPVILHVRNIHYTWFGNRFYRFLARRKIVKRLVCNSYASSRVFQGDVPEKISVLYNSIDDRFFLGQEVPPKNINKEQEIVFGYVGRLVHWKGVNILLEAFAKTQAKFPNARLLVVGENDKGLHEDLEQIYKDYCKSQGMADKVTFMGFQNDVRIPLKQMDVLVLSSIAPEPFGRVLIEAMAFHVPSIVTAHGGAIEVIENNKNGLWCKPSDAEDMSRAMNEFCLHPEKIGEMGRNGFKRLQEMFLSSTQSKKIDGFISAEQRSEVVRSL